MKPELFEFEAPRLRVAHSDHDHLESMGVAVFGDETIRDLNHKLASIVMLLDNHKPDDGVWRAPLGNLRGMLGDLEPGLRAGAYLSLLESPDGIGVTLAVMGVACPAGEVDGRERWMLPGDAALTLGFDIDSYKAAMAAVHKHVRAVREIEIAKQAAYRPSVH